MGEMQRIRCLKFWSPRSYAKNLILCTKPQYVATCPAEYIVYCHLYRSRTVNNSINRPTVRIDPTDRIFNLSLFDEIISYVLSLTLLDWFTKSGIGILPDRSLSTILFLSNNNAQGAAIVLFVDELWLLNTVGLAVNGDFPLRGCGDCQNASFDIALRFRGFVQSRWHVLHWHLGEHRTFNANNWLEGTGSRLGEYLAVLVIWANRSRMWFCFWMCGPYRLCTEE